MVMEAAKQGKHILCEKPLANSLKDAEEMVQAVENAGVRHCCGFSYRSTPAQALAKEMVAQDYLGDIFQVYARYAQDWPSSPDFPLLWRFDKNLAGSGALGDIGAHSIDAALFITGMDITSVIGQLKTMIKERPLPDGQRNEKKKVTVDDIAQFLCEFENGAAGCFEATRMATGRKNHNFIEVNGEKGSVYWDFEEQNYLYFYDKTKAECEQGFVKINATHDMHPYNGGPWPQGHGIGYSDTFVIEIANFISAVALNREFHPDFFDGLKCQRILNAVERSSLEKQWINL
jgi:predicted dehydrogenase